MKICGITDAAGVEIAAACGADCVGFVFAESERRVSADTAATLAATLPSGTRKVAVFRHPDADEVREILTTFTPDLIQSEPGPGILESVAPDRAGEPSWLPVFHDSDDLVERVRVHRATLGGGLILLEGVGRGGRGTKADWGRGAEAARLGPLALAGGLTPDNVGEAVRRVRPFAVDVSSGVESAPGIKDPGKVRGFLEAVRNAEMELQGGAAT